MHIGKDFYCNKNCLFRCCDNISFGDKALLGWNVTLQTTDGHVIEVDRQAKDNHGPIEIGNHVWIASEQKFPGKTSFNSRNTSKNYKKKYK